LINTLKPKTSTAVPVFTGADQQLIWLLNLEFSTIILTPIS